MSGARGGLRGLDGGCGWGARDGMRGLRKEHGDGGGMEKNIN